MRKVQVVTDSTCQIPASLRRELDIHVVPLPLVWDGKTYWDDEIEPREFFRKLRTASTLPTTSGPTPGVFKKEFESLGADGSPVLAIILEKELSSAFNSANLAKDMCPGVDVTIFNSNSTSMGLGFQVLAAARAARQGKDLPEILSILTRARGATGVLFAVKDLDYLVRGGRISHLQRLIAAALNLIPIMELRGRRIELVERVRSRKNLHPRLLALAAQRLTGGRPFRIAVMHADNQTEAEELANEVRSQLNPDELITGEVEPVQGVHTGPDAVGLVYSSGV